MSNQQADFVKEVTITDPDTMTPVPVAIYKDRESGAMFGVDSSYIMTLSDEDPVQSPFNGKDVHLVETEQRLGCCETETSNLASKLNGLIEIVSKPVNDKQTFIDFSQKIAEALGVDIDEEHVNAEYWSQAYDDELTPLQAATSLLR